MCLTFVGQAMASTIVSYNMMGMKNIMSQEQVSDMSDMPAISAKSMTDYSGDPMTTADNNLSSDSSASKDHCCDPEKASCSNSLKDECCDGFCNCFTAGYLSLFSLNKTASNISFIDLPSKITSFSTYVEKEVLTSLYRPPILMS